MKVQKKKKKKRKDKVLNTLPSEWIHVYALLSPFAVRLKLSQHC